MKTRLVLGGAVLALLSLVAPACSSDNTVESGSEKTSESRPTTADGDSSSGDDSTNTLPDLGDVAGSMGSCLEVAGTYASLALGVLEGAEGAAKSQEQAEDLKAKLPAELADDIDIVAETFGAIAESGVLDGAAELDDPEFTKANRNITNYLQTECGGG